eukprot:g7835.t1
MRCRPPETYSSALHPPPSFWSTSAPKQAPTVFLDDTPTNVHRTTGLDASFDGTASASTVCSVLRRRRKLTAASPGKAVCDGAAGGRLRSGRGVSRRRRPSGRGVTGCVPNPPRISFGDNAASALAAEDIRDSHGRFSPQTAVSPPRARECWGGGRSSRPHESSPPPPPPSSAPSPGGARRGGERASNDSPTRILRWSSSARRGDCQSENEELGLLEEEKEQARAIPPGRKRGQAKGGLIDGMSPRSRSPASPQRGTVGSGRAGGRGGPEVPGFAFLEIQRDLLKQLESLFVSIADDRRHALVALKREENEWKAAAMERARSDVRTAAAAAVDGAADVACSSGGGGGGLEERIREKIVEGGPGNAARRAVGLVMVDDGDHDGADFGIRGENRMRSRGIGGDRGRREEWRLPKTVVEEMRKEFAAKMDQETSEVLEQENKALLEERAGMAAREGARTKRELQELSDRLTNDGRDALAALRMELEAEEEARLAEERGRLREVLACSLQRERERLMTERKLAVFDMRDESGRESSQLAASLWEKAERSTSTRRAEAVRLLDRAAERARVQLDALLQAQEKRGLDDVRLSGSSKRKAAIKRAREESERRCLEEIKALAEGASMKNDAWLRVVLQDLRQALDEGGTAIGAGAKAAAGGGGGGEEEGGDTAVVAPALQLRAVEASEDCARLGRRLVDLVVKEALMRLKETGFDATSRFDERLESGVQTTTKTTTPPTTNDGTGSLSAEDQTLAARISESRTASDKCRDCQRLARANVELSRLLRHPMSPKPAAPALAASSQGSAASPTIEEREEGRSAAVQVTGGRKATAGAATVAKEVVASTKKAEGGGVCSGGGGKRKARVKTRAAVIRLATAGRHNRK